eukprot:gene27916-2526_t
MNPHGSWTIFSAPCPSCTSTNFSELLNRVARLVELEAAWAKGDKKLKHTFREWLWLLDEIQLVELHSGFRKLIKGLPRSRLYEIGHEVSAAAEARKRITAVGMVMKEFDPFRLELSYMTSISASGNTIYYKDSQLIRCGGGGAAPSGVRTMGVAPQAVENLAAECHWSAHECYDAETYADGDKDEDEEEVVAELHYAYDLQAVQSYLRS